MNRRMIRLVLGAAFAVPVLAAFASPASAETVTLGSTLAGDYQSPGFSISAPTISAQISFDPATSPNPVVSPVDGTITGWKVKSADDGALYTLKVLRPNGPVSLVVTTNSNFTAVSSAPAPSAVPAGTSTTTPTGVVFSYPASLPIKKGDYIGLLATGDLSDLPQNTTSGVSRNLIANNFSGQPADGASANLLSDEQHDLLLQATIEFTPPGNPGSPTKPGAAKKKCKKSKKKKRSAEVAKKKCKKKKKKG
jgi:hypothetical protein